MPSGGGGAYGNGNGGGPGNGGRSHRRGDGGQGGGEGRRAGRTARRSRRKRALVWTAGVLSFLILGTAGAGYLYYEHLNSKLKKEDLNLGSKDMADHKPNSAGQTPLNILLIGSDARDNKANQKLGGGRDTFGAAPLADVQMLIHISADRSNISVLSMPRDTMLEIPECKDKKKNKVYPASKFAQTNESLGRGGPGCTVATWYNLTGIPIDHFMMIDFAGVVSMADAIGGVPVCVEQNIHSRTRDGKGSGLKLRKGTTSIKGEDALKWLRTRYGFGDGTDLYRARAQQMYMTSMVRELRKNAKLTDPNKLRKLAEAAIDSLTVSDTINSVKKLLDIGNDLKKVPASRITTTTMPNVYSERRAGKVEPKAGEAEDVFRMIREDIPLDGKGSAAKPLKPKPKTAPVSKDPAAAPGEIRVRVQNGTDGGGLAPARGRAGEVSAALAAKGFTQASATTVRNPMATTLIRYASDDLEGDAQAVAKALGIPLTAVRKAPDGPAGITLTVGADWRQGNVFPKPKPKSNKLPTSANALAGDDDKACMPVQAGFGW
ncbi:LCP family protein [Streptomyces qinzhouensis]|uniref:LytR family transcriptional regulator n=1 Tax=Streptomyces qinzhouensis TaxID=2599401 RepID=A0A5B8JSX3_9ACTN|nr:LCP family protein [Streptomyces qinzhouensis]QDY80953.1 LytR family transcriptional regulator [Streptomyces qinzhouensis]